MLEFLNTFLIKGAYIYFGHKDKVYVIKRQLTINVFGMCVDGYVEESKGHVNKSLVVQALWSCRFAPTNFFGSMECKESRSAILCHISCHYSCHLSKGEGIVL
jgi:hypothetical protein